jgi:hypothetical protein
MCDNFIICGFHLHNEINFCEEFFNIFHNIRACTCIFTSLQRKTRALSGFKPTETTTATTDGRLEEERPADGRGQVDRVPRVRHGGSHVIRQYFLICDQKKMSDDLLQT